MKPEKIWTTVRILDENDKEEYRKQYDVDMFRSDEMPCTILELPVIDISPRGIYVTVESPEGLGPKHYIKLPLQRNALDSLAYHRGAFLSKEDCLRGMIKQHACRFDTIIQRMLEDINMQQGVSVFAGPVSDDKLEEADFRLGHALQELYNIQFILQVIQHDRCVAEVEKKEAAHKKSDPLDDLMSYADAMGYIDRGQVGCIFLETKNDAGEEILYRLQKTKNGTPVLYATYEDLIDKNGVDWIRMGYITKKLRLSNKWRVAVPKKWLKRHINAWAWFPKK